MNCLRNSPLINIHKWKIWNGLVQLAMLLSISAALNMVFFYCTKMFWELYAFTPMGQQFFGMYPAASFAISDFLDLDVMMFSMEIVVSTFVFCLFISILLKLCYVLRYFYLPRQLLGRLILFGVPLAAMLAGQIQEYYGLEYWNIAFAAALFPTLILFSGCFKFSHEQIPEIGNIIRDVLHIVIKIFDFFKDQSHGK